MKGFQFNYTILFMKYYIYTSKMHNQAIYLSVFTESKALVNSCEKMLLAKACKLTGN